MSDKEKIYVVIVEDDEVIRENMCILINESDDIICNETFSNCKDGIPAILRSSPDVVLMDIELPGISGIEGIKKIRRHSSNIDILTVTVHDDEKIVFDALCAGACGYLTKNTDPNDILNAIRSVVRGGSPMTPKIARMVIQSFHRNTNTPLTKRETEVLHLLGRGKSYNKIAETLFVDIETSQ